MKNTSTSPSAQSPLTMALFESLSLSDLVTGRLTGAGTLHNQSLVYCAEHSLLLHLQHQPYGSLALHLQGSIHIQSLALYVVSEDLQGQLDYPSNLSACTGLWPIIINHGLVASHSQAR